jgi:hypothetical protein
MRRKRINDLGLKAYIMRIFCGRNPLSDESLYGCTHHQELHVSIPGTASQSWIAPIKTLRDVVSPRSAISSIRTPSQAMRHFKVYRLFGAFFVLLLLMLSSSMATAATVTLAWDPSTDPAVLGYKVYWGMKSGQYTWLVDVGNLTNIEVSSLQDGMTYYFAATAYDNKGNESSYSNEVFYTVPWICTYSISPESQTFTASEATGSISITTQPGCSWTAAATGESWMIITSGTSGVGSGTIEYSVIDNSSTVERSMVATMAGQLFMVTQAGVLNYTLTESQLSAGCTISGLSLPCSDSTCTGNVTTTAQTGVAATFMQNQALLTVLKSGTGSGSVTAIGISCGSACSASYDAGTVVNLTPTPATGSYFAGWSSPCSGIDTCSFTLNTDTSLSAAFYPEGYPFIDVSSTHEAINYINAIYDAHITTGYGGTNEFKPDMDVTRDQLAAFIIRAKEGEPSATCNAGSPYEDVDPSSWACRYIERIYELGITTGYEGTNQYRPSLTVTRDQLAAFIIRAVDKEPPDNYCMTGSPYEDVDPSSWSCKYIKRLSELGITTGYGGTSAYKPELNVTRDQMAAFIARAFLGMK